MTIYLMKTVLMEVSVHSQKESMIRPVYVPVDSLVGIVK